jgi:hypothetical protein
VAATGGGGLAACSPSDDTPTMMKKLAEQAVLDGSQHYQTQLDYSPQSIESIEKILDQLGASAKFRRAGENDKRAEALIFGAYVGEVIRREHGGEWAADHPVVGPGTYPIAWRGGDSFPYAWCYKRLTHGEQDNVWFKYKELVMLRTKTQPQAVGE